MRTIFGYRHIMEKERKPYKDGTYKLFFKDDDYKPDNTNPEDPNYLAIMKLSSSETEKENG